MPSSPVLALGNPVLYKDHGQSEEQQRELEETDRSIGFAEGGPDDSEKYLLTGLKLVLVFTAFMMAFTLVALDLTILSTALPTIVSDFKAVSDLTWVASGYLLPQAGFLLFFGGVLTISPIKIVFLVSSSIFELGSLFCAVAPSVDFLVFGRAVAGLGAAGIWISMLSILARITTLKQRPIFMGLVGAVYAVCTVIGPLMGGSFADHVTWRWCFYINLPIGGISLILGCVVIPKIPVVRTKKVSQLQAWINLDWLGTVFSLAAVTSLLIALQWGGNTKPWNSPVVIVLLCLGCLFLVILFLWEAKRGPDAILPVQMFRRKTMVGACLESFFIQFSFVPLIYYLPLLYQIRGHSAMRSGIDILPFMVSGVIFSLVSGGIIAAKGYPWPFLFFFPFIAAVGFGLLFTASLSLSFGHLAGYQILVGVGLGATIQTIIFLAQAEYADQEELIPKATSLITFTQLLGSAIGLAISGAVFSSELRHQLALLLPDLPASTKALILEDIEAIFNLPSEQIKDLAQLAYIKAIDRVFIVATVATVLSSFSALLIRRDKLTNLMIQGTHSGGA